MLTITEKQDRILRAVARLEGRGEPGFVPDLVKLLGLAAESSLTPTLRILERKGVITVKGGGSRGRSRVVTLTPSGRHHVAMGGLPLLGWIPAGPLAEALADPETIVDERELLNWKSGDFLLRVRGTSMIGDGILDGDKVLLRPNIDPRAGEIAAVLVGDEREATLKRVWPDKVKGTIILRASNPSFPDLEVATGEVRIAGVFRGLVRDVSERGI